MAITPNDQTRQFDNPPGRSLLRALAAPSATAVAAETKSDLLADTGYNGAVSKGVTKRPSGSSAYVVAGTTPAPKQNKHTDAIRDQNDSASIMGPASPTGLSAAAPTGTSPTASVALTWVATPGAASYKIAKSVKSGAVWGAWTAGTPATVTAPTVTATETGLSTGQVRFRVTAVLGPEESPPSNVVTVTIP